MNAKLGCVLAVRDRPADVLERTLQTYAYQTVQPEDKVLVDYGSGADYARAYQLLCGRFGWRLVTCVPDIPRWHLSAAYNVAVDALDRRIDLVFKGDTDVLLGRDVFETTAALGPEKLCIFSCLATAERTTYPRAFACQADLVELLRAPAPPQHMQAEGIHAFPREWFERIGGFDLAFEGWGFEDSDLRERAKASIGVLYVTTCLLIHQWHPATRRREELERNHDHYQKMIGARELVRNGGSLAAPARKCPLTSSTREALPGPGSSGSPSVQASPTRIAVATRSMNEYLFAESGRLLDASLPDTGLTPSWQRHRITGADALGYFRDLLALDADWVVNIDEDAFMLAPGGLLDLIRHMEANGYAACGMPDGGVVPIRRHNPVACNAYFNVFDLRRVRPAWGDWGRVISAHHRREYESGIAGFARRSVFAFDHFERYYGVFFALLETGERILYLDAEEWEDGVSTLLKNVTGEPLLIHCWYSRHWDSSRHTRQRYRRVIEYARRAQGMPSSPSDDQR